MLGRIASRYPFFWSSRLPGITGWKKFSSHAGQHPPCDVLSEDENMLRETVARFASEQVRPLVKKMDEQCYMEKSVIKGLFDNGLMGVEIPSEYGGTDSTFFASILVIEELAKVDPSISIMVDIQNTLIVALICRHGTKEQKEFWLSKLAKDTIGSFCLSEVEAGSDAFALRTAAKPDGSDFLLSGNKMWISNSAEAGLFLVFANAAQEKGYKGITAFLVPRDSPGLTIGKKEDKLGLRSSSTCPLHLDQVRVPRSSVLGEVGLGYRYAIDVLNQGRIGIAAQMIGLAQGCFDNAVAYVRDRKQFGRRIWDFQAMQHQIASAAAQITATRVLAYNTARRREVGLPIQKEAAMVKWMAGNVATEVTSRSVEWLGGAGFTRDVPIEKYYRDAKIGCIYEGTSNIQLNTIAKCLDQELS